MRSFAGLLAGAVVFCAAAVPMAALAGVTSAGFAAQAGKPLVVVFAPRYPARKVNGRGGTATVPPAVAAAEDASLNALRAVRKLLTDSNLVEAIAFDPDAAVFVRAAAENKIRVVDPFRLSPDERLALGRAVGAQYVLLASFEQNEAAPATVPGIVGGGGTIIALQSVEVATRKTWTAARRTVSQSASVSPFFVRPSSGNNNGGFSPEVRSAANSVVQQFLAGPLGNYTRAATTGAATGIAAPAAAATAPGGDALPIAADPARPRDVAAEAESARKQGVALAQAGNYAEAFGRLRAAVNLQPRASAPRVALAQTYLAAGRHADAVDEARRALLLLPTGEQAGQSALARLLAQGAAVTGDASGALRATYEKVITSRPAGETVWARVALADLLARSEKPADAEPLYRAVRETEPNNAHALAGLARLRVLAGDYAGAESLLSAPGIVPLTRYHATRDLFGASAATLLDTLVRERKAFDENRATREAFYAVVNRESARAAALLSLLKNAAPPPGVESAAARLRAHKQRVFAGSQIVQGASSLAAYLETSETNTGNQANLLLAEARQQLADAQTAEAAAASQP